MQVFITSDSYTESAKVLDNRRLNKQIIECNQIYKALTGQSKGWANHCVTRLWENNIDGLMYFAWCCYWELKFRGKNPCEPVTDKSTGDAVYPTYFMKIDWWISAMRSHLLAKDSDHYSQFGWNVPAVSGYYAINKDGDWQKYSVR